VTPAEFLHALWGKHPQGQFLIWRLPSKVSTWWFDPSKVALDGYADEDVYTGVGLMPSDARLTTRQRTTNAGVVAIPGLWADIDIADDVHDKHGLPPDMDAANDLLDRLPLADTIRVHTGHGLQAWWLFEEPWFFRDRAQAVALTQWWHSQLVAAANGYAVDATHDLARVMRVPGTVNNKAVPLPVDGHDGGPRHNIDDVLDMMGPAVLVTPRPTPVAVSLGAKVNPIKLAALLDSDPKFKRSWNRKRTDLSDQSASAYDMSLASITAAALWPDDEIAALLVAWREKEGEEIKRQDYFARTIAAAREPLEHLEARRALAGLVDGNGATVDALSAVLGVPVVRFVQWVSADGEPSYDLEIEDCDPVHFSSTKILRNQNDFIALVQGVTRIVLQTVKPAEWRQRQTALMQIVEVRDTGEDTSHQSHIRQLFYEYMEHERPAEGPEDGLERHRWWYDDDGAINFFLFKFHRWVAQVGGQPDSLKELGRIFRGWGATVRVMTVPEHHTTRKVWRVFF
jgi:hypothetical protein